MGLSSYFELWLTLLKIPDRSSTGISRIIQFDYADEVYIGIAYGAYTKWSESPKSDGISFPTPYVFAGSTPPDKP